MSGSPRHRTRGGLTTASPNVLQYDIWRTCSESSFVQTVNRAPNCRTGSLETMDDYVTPSFYSRRKRGEILFNDMFYSKRENLLTSVGAGTWWRYNSGINCSGIMRYHEFKHEGPLFMEQCYAISNTAIDGFLPVDQLISGSDVADLQSEISTKCLAGRGTADSNLFESVAEIRQTLDLLRNPFNSINRLLFKAGGLRKKGASAAETWLQYRYGVLPLVSDIDSIIKGVKKKTGNVRKTTRASGSLTRTKSLTLDLDYSSVGGGHNYIGKQISDVINVRAMSLDEYRASLYENIGFTTAGLVTLPWELIPYSFVADWFVNVGDYLQALVPLPGVTSLGSCVTTERTGQVLWSAAGTTAPSTAVVLRPVTGGCTSRIVTKVRTSILPPSLQIRSDFRLDSAVRFGSAVSLLVQRMDRLFR